MILEILEIRQAKTIEVYIIEDKSSIKINLYQLTI